MAFDLDDEENKATRVANGASKESRDKNMDIKVGEYVRTKIGEIYKVENIEDYGFMCDKFYYQITKHSKQLIGIIEEQDIKTIVTHEQMQSIEYKVEENK